MDNFIKIVEAIAWPALVLFAIVYLRSIYTPFLSNSKVKIAIGGVEIETSLPEINEIIREQIGGALSPEEQIILSKLGSSVLNDIDPSDSDTRKKIRPLRNAGLVMSMPRNSFLRDADSIELTSLGNLYVRSRELKE